MRIKKHISVSQRYAFFIKKYAIIKTDKGGKNASK